MGFLGSSARATGTLFVEQAGKKLVIGGELPNECG
jgi:hypothetical protein